MVYWQPAEYTRERRKHTQVVTVGLDRDFLVAMAQVGAPITEEPPGYHFVIREADGTVSPFDGEAFRRIPRDKKAWSVPGVRRWAFIWCLLRGAALFLLPRL